MTTIHKNWKLLTKRFPSIGCNVYAHNVYMYNSFFRFDPVFSWSRYKYMAASPTDPGPLVWIHLSWFPRFLRFLNINFSKFYIIVFSRPRYSGDRLSVHAFNLSSRSFSYYQDEIRAFYHILYIVPLFLSKELVHSISFYPLFELLFMFLTSSFSRF